MEMEISAIVLASIGVISLIAPNQISKILAMYSPYSAKQSITRPFIVRLMGITEIGLAAIFYFGVPNT